MKIGVIGGIHEDVNNLKKVIQEIRGESCDAIVCLGDMVGFTEPYYGHKETRNANAVIDLVKASCEFAVIGNHDLAAINKIPSPSPFKYPDNWSELTIEARRAQSDGQVWLCDDDLPAELGNEQVEYLNSLPVQLVLETPELNILVSHYAYPDLLGDHVASDPVTDMGRTHMDYMQQHNCQLGVFDHDLQAGVRLFDGETCTEYLFEKVQLPESFVVLNGPWIANGTEPNGYMILDTKEKTVEAIPLHSEPHVVSTSH